MATCLDCVSQVEMEKKQSCMCKITPNKIIRSASLKESQVMNKKRDSSFSERRSLSLSSLNRSRSVQKLDFSMDMSIEGHVPEQRCKLNMPYVIMQYISNTVLSDCLVLNSYIFLVLKT